MLRGHRAQRRATPHEQPRGLERKSKCKSSRSRFSPRALHIKRAAWVLLREKGITPRMFESMALERCVLQLDFSQGLHRGCWIFFLRTRLCTVRNYYWSERNKTEKPSDEQPTDEEHRPGDRADQAHRARLIARSIISFGCLSLVKSVFVFVFCFFE